MQLPARKRPSIFRRFCKELAYRGGHMTGKRRSCKGELDVVDVAAGIRPCTAVVAGVAHCCHPGHLTPPIFHIKWRRHCTSRSWFNLMSAANPAAVKSGHLAVLACHAGHVQRSGALSAHTTSHQACRCTCVTCSVLNHVLIDEGVLQAVELLSRKSVICDVVYEVLSNLEVVLCQRGVMICNLRPCADGKCHN